MLRIFRGWWLGPRFARRMMNGSDTRVLRTQSDLFRRALDLIPGGVNSPVRAMRAVGLDEPLFVGRGDGAYLEDVDGNRYVDWVMSWGPLIFGHADPETLAAVVEAAERGTSFGAPTEAEVELAQEIVDAVPSIEMVRLVSSGTEAAMSVLRLARAATHRDRILKFAGCSSPTRCSPASGLPAAERKSATEYARTCPSSARSSVAGCRSPPSAAEP